MLCVIKTHYYSLLFRIFFSNTLDILHFRHSVNAIPMVNKSDTKHKAKRRWTSDERDNLPVASSDEPTKGSPRPCALWDACCALSYPPGARKGAAPSELPSCLRQQHCSLPETSQRTPLGQLALVRSPQGAPWEQEHLPSQ